MHHLHGTKDGLNAAHWHEHWSLIKAELTLKTYTLMKGFS